MEGISGRHLCSHLVPSRGSYRVPFLRWLCRKSGLHDKALLGAFYVALPNAIITAGVRVAASEGLLPWINAVGDENDKLVQVEAAVWTSIVAGLGFLVVFRATQAYTRFWQAISSVHLLQIEWVDSCSGVVAFTAASQMQRKKVQHFRHLMVRLFSLYHSAALLRLVEPGIDDSKIAQIPMLDLSGLDPETTKSFKESRHRLELVGQWIQVTILQAIHDQIVVAPPPIVSRCFQELAQGNVRFQDALKVKSIPFPKTYQLVCDLLLIMHWMATPFFTSLWVNSPLIASLLAFFSVFVFWSLILVARSIENPFGSNMFIKEAFELQEEVNSRLLILLHPIADKVPGLLVTDEELESDTVETLTLGRFWVNNDQIRAHSSEVVSGALRHSKVTFNGMSVQALFQGEEENPLPSQAKGPHLKTRSQTRLGAGHQRHTPRIEEGEEQPKASNNDTHSAVPQDPPAPSGESQEGVREAAMVNIMQEQSGQGEGGSNSVCGKDNPEILTPGNTRGAEKGCSNARRACASQHEPGCSSDEASAVKGDTESQSVSQQENAQALLSILARGIDSSTNWEEV